MSNRKTKRLDPLVSVSYVVMLENITLAMYFVIGYVITYLALETAWHFAVCRLQDKTIKHKQVKMVMTAERGYRT
ncbi:MAG: hypothetical protein WAM14_01130 [Candidatus Nitrosopolaris sp.]